MERRRERFRGLARYYYLKGCEQEVPPFTAADFAKDPLLYAKLHEAHEAALRGRGEAARLMAAIADDPSRELIERVLKTRWPPSSATRAAPRRAAAACVQLRAASGEVGGREGGDSCSHPFSAVIPGEAAESFAASLHCRDGAQSQRGEDHDDHDPPDREPHAGARIALTS